jgi:hypothetical protein
VQLAELIPKEINLLSWFEKVAQRIRFSVGP